MYNFNFLNDYTKVKRNNVLSRHKQKQQNKQTSRQVTGQRGTRKNPLRGIT